MDSHDSNFKYKLVLVGDTKVGKSSIVKRFTNGTFETKTPRTIGVDFFNKDLAINNDIIKIELWDTTGQDKRKPIMEKSIDDSDGIIAVYDITNKESFIHLNSWLKFIEKFNVNKNLLILGNKLDKENERIILTHTGKLMAIEKGAKFYEVSALSGKDVEQAIKDLVSEIHIKNLQKRPKLEKFDTRTNRKKVSVDSIICTDIGETTEVETDLEDFKLDQTTLGKNPLLASNITTNKATGYKSTLFRLKADQMERDSIQISNNLNDSQFEDLESNTSQQDSEHTLNTNQSNSTNKQDETLKNDTKLNPKLRSPKAARRIQRNNVGVGDYIIGGTVAASVLYVMFHR